MKLHFLIFFAFIITKEAKFELLDKVESNKPRNFPLKNGYPFVTSTEKLYLSNNSCNALVVKTLKCPEGIIFSFIMRFFLIGLPITKLVLTSVQKGCHPANKHILLYHDAKLGVVITMLPPCARTLKASVSK